MPVQPPDVGPTSPLQLTTASISSRLSSSTLSRDRATAPSADDVGLCPDDEGGPCAALVPPGLFSKGGSAALEKAIMEVLAVNPFTGSDVPEVEVPVRPKLNPKTTCESQLRLLQSYLSAFQYNFLPSTFFNKCKYRPLTRILETAKEVMRVALPIRCLEAAYLAIALTQGHREFQRFPLTFKTNFQGQICRHIVMGVRVLTTIPLPGPKSSRVKERTEEHWGALGLSRKADLMYKRLKPQSLSGLVDDYVAAYAGHGHRMLNVKVGLPVAHSPPPMYIPCWRFLDLNMRRISPADTERALRNFTAMAEKLADEWVKLPAQTMAAFIRSGRNDCAALNPFAEKVQLGVQGARPAPPEPKEAEDGSESEDDDEEEEDDEESGDVVAKSEVVQCILANRSPFRRNQFNTPGMSAVLTAVRSSSTQKQPKSV